MPLLTKLCQNIVLIQGFKKSKNKFSPYKQFELAYANAEDIHLAEKSLQSQGYKKKKKRALTKAH